MLDPGGLYRIDDEAPWRTADPATAPHPRVMLLNLGGYIDAGHASRLAVDHLQATLPSSVVATFDVDQLLDYRSRRPVMSFDGDHWSDYDEPMLAVYAMTDRDGTPFLLLSGPEPDGQWERFAAAVGEVVQRLGVELTVGLDAIPMAVPHTRPAGVTPHATRPELISGHEQSWTGTTQLPGSAAALVELRLGQAGRDAMGLAVHVPHYLAETEYPQAARALLDHVAVSTGLMLPTDALTEAAAEVAADIEDKVRGSEQATKVVRALEERYDTAAAVGRASLLADDRPMPTADELGAEVERFLADQDSETG